MMMTADVLANEVTTSAVVGLADHMMRGFYNNTAILCLFEFMLNIPVISYGHVWTLHSLYRTFAVPKKRTP